MLHVSCPNRLKTKNWHFMLNECDCLKKKVLQFFLPLEYHPAKIDLIIYWKNSDSFHMFGGSSCFMFFSFSCYEALRILFYFCVFDNYLFLGCFYKWATVLSLENERLYSFFSKRVYYCTMFCIFLCYYGKYLFYCILFVVSLHTYR